jgi:hypothetical protein
MIRNSIQRSSGIAVLRHCALDFYGTTDGVDRTRKFHKSAVTPSLDDAATMFGNLGVDQFRAASLEGSESAFLVIAHQTL